MSDGHSGDASLQPSPALSREPTLSNATPSPALSPSPSFTSRLGRKGSTASRRSIDNRSLPARDVRRASTDERRDEGSRAGRRLTTFLTRKRRKSSTKSPRDNGSIRRRPSAVSSLQDTSQDNASSTSLTQDKSRRSSLFTDGDSDTDSKSERPTLSPHDSHTGYLTLSAPDIASKTNTLTPAISVSLLSSENSEGEPQSIAIDKEGDNSSEDREALSADSERARTTLNILQKKKSIGDTESVASSTGSSGLRGLFKSSSRKNSEASKLSTQSAAVGAESYDDSASETSGKNAAIGARPQTPKARQPLRTNLPPLLATPPNIVDTPTTLVTPPTPTEFRPRALGLVAGTGSPARKGSPVSRSPAAPESLKHRRSQTVGSLSKLSATTTVSPLTPTAEETKTPGGTLIQPTNASGFFTSFFSTAQKATDQISNSISGSFLLGQKPKPQPNGSSNVAGGEEVIPGAGSRPDTATGTASKRLAVETLGTGNLSFSHLGLSDSNLNLPGSAQMQDADAGRKTEEEAAARAVSSAYERSNAASTTTLPSGRPASVISNDKLALQDDQTPPRSAVENDANGLKRSGSARSKISGRRKRQESSATANTDRSFPAVIKEGVAGLTQPIVTSTGHRMTGFAVASSKRNKDFHQLFRSVPEDDYLIEDYSAALQRDILLHGRLYVSEGHICFSSNILGWVTNLVISFDEVVSVEKKFTAMIFPNAIVISTLNARNVFASFVARDSTYELLIGIWKISHPNLKSSLNGVMLDDAGTGDKTEVADPDGSENDSDEGTEDEVYDEDADDDVAGSFTDAGNHSEHDSDVGDQPVSRKVSAAPLGQTASANGIVAKPPEFLDPPSKEVAASNDFPGPATHAPTECGDTADHYDRPLNDAVIPAPLGQVYSLMFGPASAAFMRKWLVEEQKVRDINYADDKIGLDNDHKSFVHEYIKPISAPVGPKQTRCITTSTLTAFDLEKAVSVDCVTQSPDVPSGNVFVARTRYCLMWGPSNSTRLIANCTIEWSGKSWLKGPIEKGALDGQTEYVKSLLAALKTAVASKTPSKATKKGKRKGRKDTLDTDAASINQNASNTAPSAPANWGFFEPIRILIDPIRPLLSSQLIITVLLLLLIHSYYTSRNTSSSLSLPHYSSPERIAAYEELWRREESALWEWLDDRVGIDNSIGVGDARQQVLHARTMAGRIKDEKMTERQMDEAIRTTEEKLGALKEAVGRTRAERAA